MLRLQYNIIIVVVPLMDKGYDAHTYSIWMYESKPYKPYGEKPKKL